MCASPAKKAAAGAGAGAFVDIGALPPTKGPTVDKGSKGTVFVHPDSLHVRRASAGAGAGALQLTKGTTVDKGGKGAVVHPVSFHSRGASVDVNKLAKITNPEHLQTLLKVANVCDIPELHGEWIEGLKAGNIPEKLMSRITDPVQRAALEAAFPKFFNKAPA